VSNKPKTDKAVGELVELWDKAVQHGVDLERASVVAWLSQLASDAAETSFQSSILLSWCCDAVKRGDHVKEVTND
jgi:hypothetical protein